MTSTTETGHTKNVANFEDLISFCTGYGTAYSPTKKNPNHIAAHLQVHTCGCSNQMLAKELQFC